MTYAEDFGCDINWVPLDDDLKYDLNEISRRVSDKTSMVFICNPNNPTGTMNSASDLEDFCLSTSKKHVYLLMKHTTTTQSPTGILQ